ncbi:MAG: ATP-binding protein [Bacteroidota bacterium]
MFTLFFIGCFVMMTLYNLLFYSLVKDRTYIYYCIYIFCNAIYITFAWLRVDDAVRDRILPNNEVYFDFFALSTTFAMVGYVAFIKSFLNLKVIFPKWDRFYTFMLYVAIPIVPFVVLVLSLDALKNEYATLSMFLYMLINVFASLPLIFFLIRTRQATNNFFIAGFSCLVLGALLAALTRFSGGISYIYFLAVGSLLEILLFSMGLAYKQMLIEKERQYAVIELEKEQLQAAHLKALNQIKTRFYTNITHEFRTPLTVIQGMTEQQEHPKAMQLIRRNSAKLLNLINQLLDLSKLDAGSLKINYKQIEVVSYIQYISESYQSLAEKKYIRLTVYSEEEELWMDVDEEKLRQIISNLLSNAIKFTDENGKVVVHLAKKENQLLIKVKDNGIGIEERALEHIFDRFYQIDNTTIQQGNPAQLYHAGGGTGVGLALVKELVELLDGAIAVQSTLGKGTTFEVQFPIKQVAAREELTAREYYIKPSILVEEFDTPASSENILPSLLLIEDNPDVIFYMQGLLEKRYQISVATNGEKGIELALADLPDLIVSDVMMPKKNGFEVVETLKQDERTSHIPIVLLTAKATQQDKIEGLKYGADAYLMKPFDKKELFIKKKNF